MIYIFYQSLIYPLAICLRSHPLSTYISFLWFSALTGAILETIWSLIWFPNYRVPTKKTPFFLKVWKLIFSNCFAILSSLKNYFEIETNFLVSIKLSNTKYRTYVIKSKKIRWKYTSLLGTRGNFKRATHRTGPFDRTGHIQI